MVLREASPKDFTCQPPGFIRHHPYQPYSHYYQFKDWVYGGPFCITHPKHPGPFPNPRPLRCRGSQPPPDEHFPVHQERIMDSTGHWLTEGCDGLSDSFEAKQLHNGYLSGSAGSPFSRGDFYHNIGTQHVPNALASFPSYPTHPSSSSYGEFPFHGMTENMFPDGLPGLPHGQVSNGLHQTISLHGLPIPHYDSDTHHSPAEKSGSVFDGLESFSSNSGGTSISHGFGSFSSIESSAVPDPFRYFEPSVKARSEARIAHESYPSTLSPQALHEDFSSPCDSDLSKDMELDAEGDSPMTEAPGAKSVPKDRPVPSIEAPKGQKKHTKATRSSPESTRDIKSKSSKIKTAEPKTLRKDLPGDAPETRKPRPASPKPSKPSKVALPKPKPHHLKEQLVTTATLSSNRSVQASAPAPAPSPAPSPKPASKPVLALPVPYKVKPVSSTEWSMERLAKDEFLLRSKREGMTYREIRKAGGFREAESTLRGRYRTLTKKKEERVRRPEWGEKDIRLLCRGVDKFAKEGENGKLKVPWKQVAEYIQQRGGSYLFGNATCRKKWDELIKNGDENIDYGNEDDE